MSNKKVVLIGYSGHAKVVADVVLARGLQLQFYTEKKTAINNPFGLKYLGFEGDKNFNYWNQDYDYVLGIGNNIIRQKSAKIILENRRKLLNVVHPNSGISSRIKIGVGNFINNNAAINAFVEIGDYCIINTGAIIDHECFLANGVHVAPGAVLAGGVEVGMNTFIGANSIIKEGIKIGPNVIIGAGSVILQNIQDNKKIVGNPGREI